MARAPRAVPDISEELERYRSLNPAYELKEDSRKNDPRAVEDLQRLHQTADGETLPPNEEARRVEMFQITIRSKIEQLDQNGLWMEKGGSTNESFRASQRTFLKTIQEVLTHPTERMLFDRNWLKDPGNFSMALESIVIDPRFISDTLLENLGLREFIPEKGTRQEDKLERRAQAIPRIKEMLKTLEPVIREGEQENQARYFRMMRVKEGEFAGQIIGTQEIDGQKRIFRCGDLQDAHRRILHIEAQYEEEVAKLADILAELKQVRDELSNWDEVKATDQIPQIKERLAAKIDELKFARDKSKVKLKQAIDHCLTLQDRSGPHQDKRFNPGKVQAKLTGAMGKGILGQRFRRITGISEKIAEDRIRTGELIQRQRAPLHRFATKVEKVQRDLLLLNPDVELQPGDKKRILENLRLLYRLSGELTFAPYNTIAAKFREQIAKVADHLKNDNRPEGAKEFVKLYLIAKIERAYTQVKQIQRRLSLDRQSIDPETLRAELQALHEETEKHMVAADVQIKKETPEDKTYYDAYVAIYYLFNSLKSRLIEIRNAEDPSAIKDAKFGEMQARIEDFDFAELVKTLDDPTKENRFLPEYPKP